MKRLRRQLAKRMQSHSEVYWDSNIRGNRLQMVYHQRGATWCNEKGICDKGYV